LFLQGDLALALDEVRQLLFRQLIVLSQVRRPGSRIQHHRFKFAVIFQQPPDISLQIITEPFVEGRPYLLRFWFRFVGFTRL